MGKGTRYLPDGENGPGMIVTNGLAGNRDTQPTRATSYIKRKRGLGRVGDVILGVPVYVFQLRPRTARRRESAT